MNVVKFPEQEPYEVKLEVRIKFCTPKIVTAYVYDMDLDVTIPRDQIADDDDYRPGDDVTIFVYKPWWDNKGFNKEKICK